MAIPRFIERGIILRGVGPGIVAVGDLGPAIPAANDKKTFDKNDVEAGRKYVQAYVPFLQYVEGIYEATKASAHGHFHEEQTLTGHAE